MVDVTTTAVTLQDLLTALMAFILAIIAYYNQQRTASAAQTAISSAATAATNALLVQAAPVPPVAQQMPTVDVAHALAAASAPTSVPLISITGPFYGNKVFVTKTGTRLLVAANGAFQLIDDRVSQDYILDAASPGAWFAPNPWTVTNPSLITWNATLLGGTTAK